MPLLLRLFFIRRSKNNRRRSHAGSEGRTVFQKNRRARLSGARTCPDEGLLQRNWRACVQKIPDRLARHGRTHEDKTSSRPGRNAVERALFHNGLCTGRGRLQENAACQAGHKRMRQRQCSVIQKNSTHFCRPARSLRTQIRSSRSSPGKGNHEK